MPRLLSGGGQRAGIGLCARPQRGIVQSVLGRLLQTWKRTMRSMQDGQQRCCDIYSDYTAYVQFGLVGIVQKPTKVKATRPSGSHPRQGVYRCAAS
jgi:hypothetical protein